MCCDCTDSCISGHCSNCVSSGNHHVQSSGQEWRQHCIKCSVGGKTTSNAGIILCPDISAGRKTTSNAGIILYPDSQHIQNLIQTSTLVQNNLRQDLDRLRTINLYEGCIQETRTCTITQSGITTYASCSTSSVNINPAVSLSPYTL